MPLGRWGGVELYRRRLRKKIIGKAPQIIGNGIMLLRYTLAKNKENVSICLLKSGLPILAYLS